MIRLRATMLDQWLSYVEPVLEEFELSTEELIARLRRETEPNEQMRAGTAFHAWLERAREGDGIDDLVGADLSEPDGDGFRFFVGAEIELALPAEREIEVQKVYDTAAGPVLLGGRLDGRDGDTVTDFKLTFGQFDAERYARSLQWRAYLDMTGARRFRHLVFQARLSDRNVWIYDLHTLESWAYPEMSEDVARRAGELAAFVAVHVPELIVDPEPANAP